MSGHNKWSSIKHKKGAADAKRGKLFTKIIREITVAAKMGGADIDANPRLRAALSSAKSSNMPNDTINRAIKKGTGEIEGASYDEFIYEGYGPGGVAVLVETATDNKNRTGAEVRAAFSKLNGNLGASGCVAWMFHTKGQLIFESEQYSEDQIMEVALEAGAEDVQHEDDSIVVLTEQNDFVDVKEAFDSAEITYISAEVTRIPESTIKVTGQDASTLLKLIDKLEDNDDVTHVYANFDIDDEELEQLTNAN